MRRDDVEFGVLPLPPCQARSDPERVDTDRDDAQHEPLEPVAPKAKGGTGEHEPPPIDVRVLGLPPLHQHNGKGVTDTERDERDEPAKQRGAEIRRRTPVELEALRTVSHGFPPGHIGLQPTPPARLSNTGLPRECDGHSETSKLARHVYIVIAAT